jgi:integrase/recombinase XerD
MSQSHNNESTFRVPDTHAKEYLRRNERIALASSTVETYDSHLTEFVNFLNDRNTSVLDADFSEVRAFAEKCVRQGNRQSTIEGKLSTVGELYRYIHLRTDAPQELSLDPLEFRDIDVSRYRTPEPIERVALSREEIRRLFDAFDSHRN